MLLWHLPTTHITPLIGNQATSEPPGVGLLVYLHDHLFVVDTSFKRRFPGKAGFGGNYGTDKDA